MSIISRLKGSEYAEFSESLAASLKRDLPPALVPDGEAISATRVAKILERAYSKAQSFALERKPGMLRRAQMANAFRWKLVDLGYDEKFVQVATEGFVVYLSRKQDPSKEHTK